MYVELSKPMSQSQSGLVPVSVLFKIRKLSGRGDDDLLQEHPLGIKAAKNEKLVPHAHAQLDYEQKHVQILERRRRCDVM